MKFLLPLLLLGAAEPAPKQGVEEIAAAFGAIADLPGEVSLAAASLGEGEPRYFLTQKAWLELATGEGSATPLELVARLDSIRAAGPLDALSGDPRLLSAAAARHPFLGYRRGSAPGAQSWSVLLRNRGGRWIGVAVIWNGDAAIVDEARLTAAVERLVLAMPDD